MTKKAISHSLADKITSLILFFFFLSGLTGLIYEILWIRMIVEIIGGAPFAISIILTVFMGGLGLGSYLASRIIDRIDQPMKLVKIYGLLELMIGAYALVIPALLVAFRPLYAIVYNRLFDHFIIYNILTFIGCAVLFCIPVICMGATLPILCRFYVTRLSHLGARAGRLYGLNTIGAATGALLCGFWLINLLGVWGTLILAVLINGVIGSVCLLAGSLSGTQRDVAKDDDADLRPLASDDTAQRSPPCRYPAVVIGALVIFAVSGFCAMSYEVIWTKLLGLIVGPTTYSFTIVLVTFILGLALGSMIFGWIADRIAEPVRLLIFTQIGAALFALVVSQLLGNSQLFFAKMIFSFKGRFALLSAVKAIVLFAFMIGPTLCLGATFPLVGKIYTQSVAKVGRSIGFAYAINTIGAVLGSFCAGFVLIPWLGKENSLSVVTAGQILAAFVFACILLRKETVRKLVPFAIPVLVGLLACFTLPRWDRHLLALGKYHRFSEMKVNPARYGWLESLLFGPGILAGSEQGELVYYGDGIGGFTTVLKYTGSLGSTNYIMANNGKPDASSWKDMKTQTLSAHLPMLFHRGPRTVMVLGLASGITAGEVLHYPVEQLDLIDISRQVVEASRFFVPWNNNVLSDPRTNLIIQDGRAHLQLTRQKYDVIISEPSNPWMAGLAALFTRDFFELAEDRLNADGIFVQFIHSYQMDWPTFALVGRTFAQVFPNSILIFTAPSGAVIDFLLVGFKSEQRLNIDNARRKLSCVQKSKNVVVADPRLLYRLIASEDLGRLFDDGPVNTDNHPRLEFAAPKLMHSHDPAIGANIKSRRWLSPETGRIIKQVVADVDSRIDYAAYALSLYEPFRNMVDLSIATPKQKQRFFDLVQTYCADNPIDYSILASDELKQSCRDVQIRTLEDKMDLMPDKARSYIYLAGLYLSAGRLDEAVAACTKVIETEPENARAHHNAGAAYFEQGKYRKAAEHFGKSLQIQPDNADAHNYLGVMFIRQSKFDRAIAHFNEAIRIEPDFVKARNNLDFARSQQAKSGQRAPR